jgi:RHS repeat-associated protein
VRSASSACSPSHTSRSTVPRGSPLWTGPEPGRRPPTVTSQYVAAREEWLTGRERDPETGLDYFGARYDMSALARWATADPLGEKHPEWTPYNYVLNNPAVLIDPDRAPGECERRCEPLFVQSYGRSVQPRS